MNDHFCGWYFKMQSPTQALALIPAEHTHRGQRTCSVQIVTEHAHWNIPLPGRMGPLRWDAPYVQFGATHFSPQGMELHLYSKDCRVTGQLHFGPLVSLPRDIMGPFRLVPFLECRHRVSSLRHTVTGCLQVNDISYHFEHGMGYIEGDRGRSFPKNYVWTQCLFPKGSLMLCAAQIPFGPFSFTGILSVLSVGDRVFTLATYLGAKVLFIRNSTIAIQQHDLILTAQLLSHRGHPLRAPQHGTMSRTIHENLSCHARYTLAKSGKIIWAHESRQASFEYEYPQ